MKPQLLFTKKLNKTQLCSLKGFEVECIPFIKTNKNTTFNEEGIKEIENIIISSKKAVFALKQLRFQPQKIYAVGKSTQQNLEQKGYNVHFCAETALQLTAHLKNLAPQRFLYFCANIRRNEIPDFFAQSKHNYTEKIVYHTTQTPQKIIKNYNGIIFFSPSAIKSYLKVNKIPNKTLIFALGKTTATELMSQGFTEVKYPESANWEALLSLIKTEYYVQK